MKKYAGVLLTVVGFAAAAAYYYDRMYLTDASSGLAVAGSVWLRYLIAAVVLALAALACLAVDKQSSVITVSLPAAAAAVLSAVMCLFAAATRICGIDALGGVLLTTVLLLLSAVCGFFRAFSYITGKRKSPDAAIFFGILGSLYPFLLVLQRFASNESSFFRFSQTIGVYSALAALVFSTVLIRCEAMPDSASPRKLFLSGMVCFLLCFCYEIPELVACRNLWMLTAPQLMTGLVLGSCGLSGLAAAFTVLKK